tara:strand:+ start:108 stop:710 length:603 start_codon:yes stop_codon:yes gene_type:complete
MKSLVFIPIILFFGCNDSNISGYTTCATKEPDQKKSITFEHFKSDFDVYWDSEEKMASLALSKSKFSKEQKQNLFNSLDMDLYSEDIVSVTVYSRILEDSMSLSSPLTMGLLIFSLDNTYLTARLFSNDQNELKKVVDSKVSFISTNDIANAGKIISSIHDSKAIHSLVFINYDKIPRERMSRPIFSEILDTLWVERVFD